MTQLNIDRTASSAKPQFSGAAMPLAVVGQWELVAMVAEGEYSEVHLARPAGTDVSASAAYAVKCLKKEFETDPRAMQTLRREAVVGRLVSHPHLISVLSGSTNAPPYYIVMPWLTGVTLGERIAQSGPLEAPEAIWIVRQIADALDALDTAGWMHGDVKPSNIFLSSGGHATLLDLGFARRTDRSASQTEPYVAGTGHYLAPEASLPALGYDIRSDLYSLGVTLLEMLSGRPPFAGACPADLAREHRRSRPGMLDEIARRLPSGVATLLRRMLAKEPLRRPQTPGEVVRRLVRAEIESFARR